MRRRLFLNPSWLIPLAPVYIACRLFPALSLGSVGIGVASLALIASLALVVRSVRTRSDRHHFLATLFTWFGLTAMGFFSSLFVLTLLRDALLLSARAFLSAAHWAVLVSSSARGVLALTGLVTLIGLVMARARPRIVNVDIPVTDLPKGLHGFSIAQISDVHVGPTIKRGFVESIVRRVNALRADVVAVTGDLVDGSVQQLSRHTAPLAGLAARHGAFFVTGNHEYYSGERAWTRELGRLGLRVLKNEHVVLRHNGASLVLAGVDDVSAPHFDAAQRSDPAAALRGSPADAGARILLAHQPTSAPAAAQAGFDVQLSGHTHGGQFWPWNLLVRYFQPFTAGIYRLKRMMVYVSRGTGYWGPPNRFGVPPEITHIRLVPSPT